MDLKEVDNNYSIENEITHWWIRSRFRYIDQALNQISKNELKIVEYGCGTGQNLYYITELCAHNGKVKELIGIDTNHNEKYIPGWLKIKGGIFNDPRKVKDKADFIIAMDVLEHIEDDINVLNSWVENLNDGGLVLITVPAFNHLWSNHDINLGHFRRYNINQLLNITSKVNLEPIKTHYAFSFIYPIVLLQTLIGRNSSGRKLNVPNNILNYVLSLLGKLEYYGGGSKIFGTSVVGIFQKKCNNE